MPNFARKGIPYPYLITPRNDGEANLGKATLMCPGDIESLLKLLRKHAPREKKLIAKLSELA